MSIPVQWRPFLVAALILCGPVLAYTLTPTMLMADSRKNLDLQTALPPQIGQWRMQDNKEMTVVSPDVQAALAQFYSQTLTRIYVNPQGYSLMLSIAYGREQNDALRIHNPEICYSAQGFELSQRDNILVYTANRQLDVKHVVARQGARNEPISYWITVGDRVANETPLRKRLQIEYGLKGMVPDGLLVRVSSIDQDPQRAYALQSSFIQALGSTLKPDTLRMFMGQPL